MSLRTDENKRRSYAPPVIKLACVLVLAIAAKAGDEVVKARFGNQYSQLSTVLFCVVAAVCAYLAYRAIMDIGYVWDSRHPKATEEAASREYTPEALCGVIGSVESGRIEFDIVFGGKTTVAGAQIIPMGDEGESAEKFYLGKESFADFEAFHAALQTFAGESGKLTVAQVRSDEPIDGNMLDVTVKEDQ